MNLNIPVHSIHKANVSSARLELEASRRDLRLRSKNPTFLLEDPVSTLARRRTRLSSLFFSGCGLRAIPFSQEPLVLLLLSDRTVNLRLLGLERLGQGVQHLPLLAGLPDLS